MATFYVLPPRAVLGECLARFLRPFIPGVPVNRELCADLIDSLVAAASGENACILHREELPEGHDMSEALRDACGAEDGDQIILVNVGPKPDEPRVRVWTLAAA
jgi:hypothetical protein